ncbi:hypothetical protein RFI_15455, partial [Reticulomyxa filosa]
SKKKMRKRKKKKKKKKNMIHGNDEDDNETEEEDHHKKINGGTSNEHSSKAAKNRPLANAEGAHSATKRALKRNTSYPQSDNHSHSHNHNHNHGHNANAINKLAKKQSRSSAKGGAHFNDPRIARVEEAKVEPRNKAPSTKRSSDSVVHNNHNFVKPSKSESFNNNNNNNNNNSNNHNNNSKPPWDAFMHHSLLINDKPSAQYELDKVPEIESTELKPGIGSITKDVSNVSTDTNTTDSSRNVPPPSFVQQPGSSANFSSHDASTDDPPAVPMVIKSGTNQFDEKQDDNKNSSAT